MQEIKVTGREEGGTLIKLLGKYLKDAPASFFYKMLRKKNITLNGKKAEGREHLVQGDVIRLFLSDDTIRQFGGAAWLPAEDGTRGTAALCVPAEEISARESEIPARWIGRLGQEPEIHVRRNEHSGRKPEIPAWGKEHSGRETGNSAQRNERPKSQPVILYEDEDILLIGKPAGWLTQKAAPGDFSLNEWVVEHMQQEGSITERELSTFRPGVCNRLDRNTSGIVSAGKTLAGLQFLSETFRERTLRKYYTCIVAGKIDRAARMEGYLKKNGQENLVSLLPETVHADIGYGKVSLAYEPLSAAEGFTYLKVELITGKTHQIRAQLAAAGHPILGDVKYTDEAGKFLCRKYHTKHQCLHAGQIVFGEYEGRFSYLNGKEFTVKEPGEFLRLKERIGFSPER
ncbi:MAG: RluA family pseudouridine synthase [Lachnospiraceae bacterium]|nr:RluA family pseudouridine synthase [Lachnospiraceae bacterium]